MFEYIKTAFKVVVGVVTNDRLAIVAGIATGILLAWVILSLVCSFQLRFAKRAKKLREYVSKNGFVGGGKDGFEKLASGMPSEFNRGYTNYLESRGELPSKYIKRFQSLDVELSGGVFNQNKSVMKTYINFVAAVLMLLSLSILSTETALTGYMIAEAALLPLGFLFVTKIIYYVYTAIRQYQYRNAVDEFNELLDCMDEAHKIGHNEFSPVVGQASGSVGGMVSGGGPLLDEQYVDSLIGASAQEAKIEEAQAEPLVEESKPAEEGPKVEPVFGVVRKLDQEEPAQEPAEEPKQEAEEGPRVEPVFTRRIAVQNVAEPEKELELVKEPAEQAAEEPDEGLTEEEDLERKEELEQEAAEDDADRLAEAADQEATDQEAIAAQQEAAEEETEPEVEEPEGNAAADELMRLADEMEEFAEREEEPEEKAEEAQPAEAEEEVAAEEPAAAKEPEAAEEESKEKSIEEMIKERGKQMPKEDVKDNFKLNFDTLLGEDGGAETEAEAQPVKRGRGRPKKEVTQSGEFVIRNDKDFEEALVRAEKLMRKNEEPLSASQTKRIEKQIKELVDAMTKYKESK